MAKTHTTPEQDIRELVYEPHIMPDPLLPFIFNTDRRIAGEKQPPNWHYNTEILFCTSGSGYVVCENSSHSVQEGELLVINSGDLHALYADNRFEYYYLIIDRDFCSSNGISTEFIRFVPKICDIAMSRRFESIIKAYGSSGPCRVANIRCAILNLLILLRAKYTESNIGGERPEESVSTNRIKQVMVYIRQNLSKTFTLEEIAAHIGINKYYLTREFKRITGQTVFEYINVVRCKEAKRLITDGMNVSAAARGCGFENMSYFSRTYKKCIGNAPSNNKN